MNTTRTLHTAADLDAMTENPEWQGFGYIGGRRNLDDTARRLADEIVLDFAFRHGWSTDDLFAWANSRSGRHYADAMDGAHVIAADGRGDLAIAYFRIPRD